MSNKINLPVSFFCFFLIFSLSAFFVSPRALASPYFPFSQISQGMVGLARTVFYGTEVESFSLEVLDVVEGRSIEESYFVVLVTDERVREMGGISQGMSGSPVFFEGQIAGALAYSWETKDNLIGVVTPIEAMLKLWEKDSSKGNPAAGVSPVPLFGGTTLVRGLGERSMAQIEEQFKAKGITTLPYYSRPLAEVPEMVELKPGSAIGVQLVSGDADIISVGTLTWREEDKFLALGHPFLHAGEVNYFLSSVYINFSSEGKDFPFKVGTPIRQEGVVRQDRAVGVAGRIGVVPPACQLDIRVEQGGESSSFSYKVVQGEDFLVDLIPQLVLDSLDRALDCQTSGSIKAILTFAGERFYLQDDFFWTSEVDIASLVMERIREVIRVVFKNPIEAVEVSSLEIDLQFYPSLQNAIIKTVDFPLEISRGEGFSGTVGFFLYRQGLQEFPLTLQLPSSFPLGEADLLVKPRVFAEQSPAPVLSTNLFAYLEQELSRLKEGGISFQVVPRGGTEEEVFTFYLPLPLMFQGQASQKVIVEE